MNDMWQSTVTTLAGAPDLIERAFFRVPAIHRHVEPASWEGIPGERFSAAGQICHLRDIEIDGYHVRIGRMLAEDRPSLVSLDGYAIATQRRHASADPEKALAAFRAARVQTLALLAELTDAQLERRGDFAEYGEISLRGLIHFLSSHDHQHLACLDWLLGRLYSDFGASRPLLAPL